MRIQRIAATAACATALLGGLLAPSAAAAPGTEQPAANGVAVHSVKDSAAQVKAYWTPERMRKAVANPAPMPTIAPSAQGAGRKDGTADKTSGRLRASADAVGPKTASLTAASTSQSMAAASEISVAQEVPYSTSFPNVIVGKLFFTKPDGRPFTCTASVIVSNNKRTLWTAGHCVHLGDGSGSAGWSTNVEFVPGYKDGQEPWGRWYADKLIAPNAWLESGDNRNGDLAAIVLKSDATYGNIQDNVGALGYVFGGETDYADVTTYGYPGDGYNRTDMTGERMMFCHGNSGDADPWWPTDDRLKMDCDMGHGASGGPMFIGALSYNPQIVGANSHYEADATTNQRLNDDLFSSLHDVLAVNVINEANATS
ncbi:trypsin-like serine peptidase [Streptomyces sp. NPDC048425]|uniref:trypsin-like serine peptidase n=1 Tax=Streptomyces sp. NPDC048425 TaxID=3365548 RepID=UPI00371F0876